MSDLEALLGGKVLSIGDVLLSVGVLEAAPGLAVLELGADSRADASIHAVEGGRATGAAALLAVGVAHAAASGELLAISVAHVGSAGLVGDELGRGNGRDLKHIDEQLVLLKLGRCLLGTYRRGQRRE
jgi:hypothetical protein